MSIISWRRASVWHQDTLHSEARGSMDRNGEIGEWCGSSLIEVSIMLSEPRWRNSRRRKSEVPTQQRMIRYTEAIQIPRASF